MIESELIIETLKGKRKNYSASHPQTIESLYQEQFEKGDPIAVGFFDLQELVKLSLRLRPQRIVVGEIRGAEAKDYLLALSTGHSGGLTTIHAKSAREALWRLQLLIQMGAPQWGTNVITGLIQQGIDYVIGVTQKEGQRRLSSIVKVCGYEGEQFLLESAL